MAQRGTAEHSADEPNAHIDNRDSNCVAAIRQRSKIGNGGGRSGGASTGGQISDADQRLFALKIVEQVNPDIEFYRFVVASRVCRDSRFKVMLR